MSKDYKGKEQRHASRGSGSSLLAGILIGLVLGLGIALAVAWYINKMPSPFASRPAPAPKVEAPKAQPPQTARVDDKAAKAEEKPRFDFYKILPGEEAEKQGKDTQKASTPAGKEAFLLQAGAFQNPRD